MHKGMRILENGMDMMENGMDIDIMHMRSQ